MDAVATRVVGDGIRAAVALAPVQGGVRVAIQQAAQGAGRRIGGDPDRKRERFDGVARERPVERAGEHPPRDGQPGLDVGAGQHDGELVAADPERPVATTDGAQRDTPDRSEEFIAHRVAVLVVDLLEVVDVDEQQGERGLVAGRVLELATQLLLERPVVAQAGQAVEQRVLARPPVQVDQPGAVVLESLDVADDRPGQLGHQDRDEEGAQREEGERQPGARPPGQKPSTAATPMSTANIAASTRSNCRLILR